MFVFYTNMIMSVEKIDSLQKVQSYPQNQQKPVESSKSADKKMSDNAKIMIGATVLAGIIAVGIIGYKQGWWAKLSQKAKNNTPFQKDNSQNITEGVNYLKSKYDINVDMSQCTNSEFITKIDSVLEKYRTLGITEFPNITVTSFKPESLREIWNQRIINYNKIPGNFMELRSLEQVADRIKSPFGEVHGFPQRRLNEVFINQSIPPNEWLISHEIAHIFEVSEKGEGPITVSRGLIEAWKRNIEFMKDSVNTDYMNRRYRALTDPQNKEYYYDPNDESTLNRLLAYYREAIAEITASFVNNPKTQFPDKTMALYGLSGGCELPKLKIKNMNYNDYMSSLCDLVGEMLSI